jgi:predicted metal-dependent phosphoesterase TrpH
MKYCDLHTHSVYSDGTYTPAELIREAEARNLAAIALTDHNTVAGLRPFLDAARDSAVEAIPGVEFSTEFRGTELHILALFLDESRFDEVTDLLEDFRRRKDQSNADLVARLNAAGYVLDYERIKAATPGGQVNRAHIAAELTAMGYTASNKEAFKTLLAPECGYYIPPARLDALEAVRFIRSLGAVSVWAHPFLTYLTEEEVFAFLEQAVPAGLVGMETIYSTYDEATTQTAKAMAARFGLKESGGSDFHGSIKPDIQMGIGKGALAVPCALAENLRLT